LEKRLGNAGIVAAVNRRIARATGEKPSVISLRGTMIAVAATRGADEGVIAAQGGCRTSETIERWKGRARVGPSISTERLGF
jgi:hypothetical protein